MSLLPALDDSENSPGHGWNASSRFSIETPTSGKQFGETESTNLYHHLINQNNAGDVPEALVEEEIINESDGNVYYSDQQQFHMSKQQQQQQQHQQSQKQQQEMHQIVQQHQTQQLNASQQQQKQQQQIYSKQINQQQRLQSKIHAQKQVTQPSNTAVNIPHNNVTRQNVSPIQPNYQTIVHTSQTPFSQADIINYNVPETTMMLKMKEKVLNNKKEIEENNALLKSLGFPPVSTSDDPSNSSHVVNNCDFDRLIQSAISSQSNVGSQVQQYAQSFDGQQRKMTINIAGNNSTMVSPTGQRIVTTPSQGQQKTMVLSGNRPNIISHSSQRAPVKQGNSLLNQAVQGNKSTSSSQQNPVQVQTVSTNQNQSLVNKPGMAKITKKNVVLEGGGQFEDGQAYVIRDRHGNSKTMVWRNGEFQPYDEKQTAIQHSTIDSSQRGRGGRGRGKGRGRGQGHGNATGVHMVQNVRGSLNNGVRIVGPNMQTVRSTQPTLLHQALHSPNFQTQIRQFSPRGHIINTSRSPSPIISVVTTPGLLNQGIPPKISLKNLMPAQTVKQKTAEDGQTSGSAVTETVEQKVTETTAVEAGSVDPPNVPVDPSAVAVCQYCGTTSMDKFKCESCKRSFTSATKYVIPNKGSKDCDPESKRRKLETETTTTTITFDKSAFYNKKIQDQSEIYVKVINAAVSNTRSPRIIRPVISSRGRRGRGRGRGMALPETVTISSDEEECPDTSRLQSMSAPCTPASSQSRSPSHNSDQSECPESPLIPNIPVSKRSNDKARVKKMETAEGQNLADKTPSIQFTLNATAVRVGTFRGAPIEPVLISRSGLSFYIEGVTGSHSFHLYPAEIQQCLAKLDSRPYLIFFLTNQGCAVRTRKDLGMSNQLSRHKPPPDIYFDPSSAEMRHQMITIVMDELDPETKQEFQRFMEMFKSWGKQGDEAFFMELSLKEAEEIYRQSTTEQKMTVVSTVPMMTEHGISNQQGEEDRQSDRSPSPKIGFVGPILKLLTFPPAPEKGGICITNEDLYCLQEGEFLNDVIIDFYLKYLLRDKLSTEDRERTHIFSSFFYKRLTQRIRGAAIDDDPSLSLPEKRHARVKTWTRHVDLFKKDFIVIPINEHAHWFLAIICFPGLEGPVDNVYIPKPVAAMPANMAGVPSPPQPTEDDGDENMETEDGENPLSNTSANPHSDVNQSSNMEQTTSSQESTSNAGEASQPTQSESNAGQEAISEKDPEESSAPTEENSEMDENTSQAETSENLSGQTECQTESEKTEEKMDASQQEASSKAPKNTKAFTVMRGIRGTPVSPSEPRPLDAVTGIRQPCIIVFDSLFGPSRSRIVNVLKEYLQVEWAVKKGGKGLNKSIFKGCIPKVPQQNNFSDCGVFMLQYVESFFEDPVQDFLTPMKGLHDWFSAERIEGKREELRDLIIELKEKYESKTEGNS